MTLLTTLTVYLLGVLLTALYGQRVTRKSEYSAHISTLPPEGVQWAIAVIAFFWPVTIPCFALSAIVRHWRGKDGTR